MPLKDKKKLAAYSRKYYREHKDTLAFKRRQWQRLWRKENWPKYLWYIAKKRAKQYGLPFTITPDDIVIPERCPVFGFKFVIGENGGSDRSPSIDKMIPQLGYVPQNITIISRRANRIKSDASLDELKKIVDWLSEKNNTKV